MANRMSQWSTIGKLNPPARRPPGPPGAECALSLPFAVTAAQPTVGLVSLAVSRHRLKMGRWAESTGVLRLMLQSIRDGLSRHKWLQYTLLGALALVFAAWGAYGIVNLNVDNANYAAEAGGQKISIQRARNAWLQMQQRFGGAGGNPGRPGKAPPYGGLLLARRGRETS